MEGDGDDWEGDVVKEEGGKMEVGVEEGEEVMVGYEEGNGDGGYVRGGMLDWGWGKGGDEKKKRKRMMRGRGKGMVLDDERGSMVISEGRGKEVIVVEGRDGIRVMGKKRVRIRKEDEWVMIMEEKSIGLEGDRIWIGGRGEGIWGYK